MIKYVKFKPSEYVLVVKGGKLIKKGIGLSVFYNTISTGIVVVPTTAFEASFIFDDISTTDFQQISVQGDISFVISDYEKANTLVDFTFTDNKSYKNILTEAKYILEKRIINLAKVSIAKFFSGKDVREAIKSQDELAKLLLQELKENEVIANFGISVLAVSVLGILPQNDMKKALEACTREAILQQQDYAIYQRRKAAIEQDRIIKENELNTEIQVVEKEREKKEKALEAQMAIQEKTALANMKKLNDDKDFAEAKSLSDMVTRLGARMGTEDRKKKSFKDGFEIEF